MIFNFNVKEVPSISQVGGKAKALIETTIAGFPVPEGFVLSVDYFKPWIETITESENWKKFQETPNKNNCDALKMLALEVTFTDKQKKYLKKTLSEFSDTYIFAVRSSSPEEDLSEASFAGQYETKLGVTVENLESVIKEVFSSVLDFRVMEYKTLNGLTLDLPRIAIIIQRQIPSDISGITFSLNPNNNSYDETVINASFGLGETIVSGQVTPDTYIVDKHTQQIHEKNINEKKVGLWLMDNGGTLERTNENPNRPALSDKQIIEVADLAYACEKHYEKPMDIEWAIHDGRLYLLQARPITTHFPLYSEFLTEPGETKHLYADLVKLSQGFEESLSVLGADLFSRMITNAKMGTMPYGKEGAFFTVHGRIYMDFTNIAKALSPGYIKKFIGNYDVDTRKVMKDFDFSQGYTLKNKPEQLRTLTWDGVKMILKVIPAIKKTAKDPRGMMENYFSQAEQGFRFIDELIETDKTFSQCVDDFMALFRSIMSHAIGVSASIVYGKKIRKMFKGMDLDGEIISLTIDLWGNPTSEMGYSLVNLAKFPEVQETENGKDFADAIQSRSFTDSFMAAYDKHMKRFGCRCIREIDTAVLRPYENLEEFFKQLKLINIDNNAMQDSKQKKDKAYAKLLEAAVSIGKEKQFIQAAEILKVLGIREHPKYMYVYANDKFRQMALKLARGFYKEGRLEAIDDIFMVDAETISKAQVDSSFDLKSIVEKNKIAREMTKNVKSWPKIIDSRGKIFRYKRESENGDLVGDPVSPGIIKGRAKVLSTPFEKPVNPGEILVAKATEPTWTPVFINATAVVMEVGGPLQHGAIIAREYGIPCVTGIFEATKKIKDGDMLEVDGSSGLVKILT